jgi:7-cyano-7-deazaguanine reductase
MPKPEGKIFSFKSPENIKTSFLETIPYQGEKQLVNYSTSEFSAVCPFSGLPDYGQLNIEYIPKKLIVELKSLKYYLVSFRDIGIYQEAATNRLFRDLWQVLNPQYLHITTIYNTRGGLNSTCQINKGEK